MDGPVRSPERILHPPHGAPLSILLHAALFAVTGLTATVAGTLFWEDSPGGVGVGSWDEMATRPWALLSGWPYAACLLLVLLSHEMGHYLACRYHGIPVTLPFFLPAPPPFILGTFGAVIRIRGVIPHRRALFDVAAAGPLAGFAVALPILVAGVLWARPLPVPTPAGGWELGSPLVSAALELWIHGDTMIQANAFLGAGWVGMLVTSLNLFPVGQLDGGHAAYAVSRRLHRVLSKGTIFGLVALVSYQFHSPTAAPVYLVWLVVSLILRDRHPRLEDETMGLGRGRLFLAVLLVLIFLATFIPVPIAHP